MSRYIDAEKTELELWDHGVNMGGEYQGVWVRFRDIEEVFKNAPTADVVEVVRCKDCKWWGAERFCENSYSPCFQNCCTLGNWFCAEGEKVTENG